MSIIFISHSSKDNKIAAELRSFLEEQGHQSVFLDFDPADGIPAGRSWEKELYTQLRGCRAVIVLCSEHSMSSDWCFAEITHAKSLGKHLFPIKVGPCNLRAVLTDVQVVDRSDDREEAYQRLGRGLIIAGLDPRKIIDWKGDRPPYPGLLAFKEEDAAVFFGRDDAIQEGLDVLNRLNRFGGSRLTLVLGASGSGKSSLVRAGLVPRLKRDSDRWLVVDPFRPLNRPLQEIALVLCNAFKRYETPSDWEAIHATLLKAANQPDADGGVLLNLAESLRIAAGHREATVLLVIDQVEEILGYAKENQATHFLPFLRAALEAPNSPIMAVGTLRSDFLGAFQNHRALRDLSFESLTIGPLSVSGFAQVIEGPAEVAGVELELGLVQLVVTDTETDDALPLLAFTLSELWNRYGSNRQLTIEEYRDKLGGLEGSVARAAEAVISAEPLSLEAQEDLRHAFISMVQITEEGQYARRPVRWADLPKRSHALLERFVDARLLVSSSDEQGDKLLEVAHEALFRAWRQLKLWLDEDRDRIRLLESVRRAAREWEAGDREPQLLVHRDRRLADVETLVQEPRFALATGAVDQAYLNACLEAQQARERARRSRIRKTIGALITGLCIFAGLAVWAAIERAAAQRAEIAAEKRAVEARIAQKEAERQRLMALSRQLAAQIPNLRDDQLDLALLLSMEANRISNAVLVRGNLLEVLESNPRLLRYLRGHSKPVRSVAFSPDGRMLASGSLDGNIRLWDVTRQHQLGPPLLGHTAEVYSVAVSPDGHTLASSSEDSSIVLWDITDLSRPKQRGKPLLGHTGRVHSIAFSPDGELLVSGGMDKSIILWDLTKGQPHGKRLKGHTALVKSVVFSPDGRTLASGDDNSNIILWDVEKWERRGSTLKGHTAWIMSLAFSPDSQTLASGSGDKTIILWDVNTPKRLDQLRAHSSWVRSVAYSPNGRTLASAGQDGEIILWDVATREPLGAPLKGHSAPVLSVAFSPDGHTMASGGDDSTVVLWDILRRQRLGEPLANLNNIVMSVAFSPDGNALASGGGGNSIFLWNLKTRKGTEMPLPPRKQFVRSVAFSPDGEKLASGNDDSNIILWDVAGGRQLKLLTGHTDKVMSVAFSPDGSTLASGSKDNTIILWDVTSGQPQMPVRRHRSHVMSVAFSLDAKWLATGSWDKTARLWKLNGPPNMINIDPGLDLVNTVAFSPDGKTLAIGSHPRYLTFWNVAAGEHFTDTPTGHTSNVLNVAFSPDGKILASSDQAGTVILWDAATRQPLGKPLKGHTNRIHALAFSPDGRTLASGSHDKTIILWDIDFDSWKVRACNIANRNLTRAEWNRFVGPEISYENSCPE